MLGDYILEISNFSYVPSSRGLRLRLTLVIKLESSAGLLGVKMEGVLVSRDTKPGNPVGLSVKPPTSLGKYGKHLTTIQFTIDLCDQVVKLVKQAKKWEEKIGRKSVAKLFAAEMTETTKQEVLTRECIKEG